MTHHLKDKFINPWITSIQNYTSAKKTEKIISWLHDYNKHSINSRLIDERRCIPPNIILDLGNHGLLGMFIEKQYGGLQLDFKDAFKIIEILATIDTSLAIFVGLNNVLGNCPIAFYANEENKKNILPQLAMGNCLACLALTEPGAGSNPRAMQTTAKKNRKGIWIINGEKIWIGSAAWANYINVIVQLIDENDHSIGLSAFTINRDRAGIAVKEESLTMGVRGMIQSRIIFHNVEVTCKELLGQLGEGFEVGQSILMLGRVGISAICLGALKKSYLLTYNYAKNRKIITGELLDNPITQLKLSEQTYHISLIENLISFISNAFDNNENIPEEIYILFKIIAPELLWKSLDNCIQILGGRGYIESNILPQIFRDARLLRIFEGPTETLAFHLGTLIFHTNESLIAYLNDKFNASADILFLKDLSTAFDKKHHAKLHESDHHLLNKWLHDFGKLSAYIIAKIIYQYQSKPDNNDRCSRWLDDVIINLQAKLTKIYDAEYILDSHSLSQKAMDYENIVQNIEQQHPGIDLSIDDLMKR